MQKQGRLDDAIIAIEKTIEIQVDNTEAHYQLAPNLYQTRRKEKSRHSDGVLQSPSPD